MTNTKSSDKISAVVDNNIICDLYELGRLGLLFEVFDVVCFPRLMYKTEILPDIKKIFDNCNYDFIVADLTDENGYSTYDKLVKEIKYKNLSEQDKMVISIAEQYSYCCNSNDGLVRKACKDLKIQCIGILGIIEIAYNSESINLEELKQMCADLESEKTSCYIDSNTINKFLTNIN